jgi:predicted lipoprotein with Yx(FWY)xxD motif
MKRAVVLFALALASAALAVAASGSTPRAKVQLHLTPLGKVLADARGHTLYLYSHDSGKKSACYGSCAAIWPPLLTTSTPLAGTGVKKALLTTAKRKDGKLQVLYAGHPLYLFSSDAKAGQASGQDVEDFFVVSSAGKAVKSASSSSNAGSGAGTGYDSGTTTTSADDGSKGGYTYP